MPDRTVEHYVQPPPLAESQPDLLAKFNHVPDSEVITSHGMPSKVSMTELDVFESTGQLVACDPHFLPFTRPLAMRVPPGTFSVTIFKVKLPRDGNRVALAWVFPTDRPVGISGPAIADVTEWRPALYEGDTGQASKMAVDYGMAAYCDSRVAAFYAESQEAFDAMRGWLEAPYYPRYEGRDDDPDWMPVVGFMCGLGDGSYPSYWGFDAEGNVLGLLTDFLLISGDAERAG